MKEKIEELKRNYEYVESNMNDVIDERNKEIERMKSRIVEEKNVNELVSLLLTAAERISSANKSVEGAVSRRNILKATIALLEN